MNTLKWFPVAGLIILSACAPTAMRDELATPILAPGQVWTFATDPVDGQTAVPNVLTVGTPKRFGTGSVGFLGEAISQGSITTTDGFYYDPIDSDPEFIAATRIQVVSGVSTIQGCIVRNPVNQLNVSQTGLFQSGPRDTNVLGDQINPYINTGTLTGQKTCTLMRIK